MNLDEWKPVRRNERRYLNDLEAWFEEFIPWSLRTGHEPGVLLPDLDALARTAAERIARRMITGVAVTNATSWRAAARESLQGRRIYESLKREMGSPVGVRVDELIRRNAKLIETMPDRLARRTAQFIGREQRRGTRASAIEELLRKRLPEVTRSEMKMLARTEVGRAETALTQARAERLGVAWYEWATSEDQRVRPSHKLVDHVLVRWVDPLSPERLAREPSPFGHYAPGTVPNCRCLALPLIDLNEVAWPHGIYMHGRIERVTRAEFARWNRGSQAA